MRDQATNKNITHKDDSLKQIQKEKRIAFHNKQTDDDDIEIEAGEHVMLKDNISKLKPREKFLVMSKSEDKPTVILQKQDSKFTARQYEVPKHQLLKVPQDDDIPRPKRKAAVNARKKINEWSTLLNIAISDNDEKLHAWDEFDDEDDTCYVT